MFHLDPILGRPGVCSIITSLTPGALGLESLILMNNSLV